MRIRVDNFKALRWMRHLRSLCLREGRYRAARNLLGGIKSGAGTQMRTQMLLDKQILDLIELTAEDTEAWHETLVIMACRSRGPSRAFYTEWLMAFLDGLLKNYVFFQAPL